jgi:hypothetical protein
MGTKGNVKFVPGQCIVSDRQQVAAGRFAVQRIADSTPEAKNQSSTICAATGKVTEKCLEKSPCFPGVLPKHLSLNF